MFGKMVVTSYQVGTNHSSRWPELHRRYFSLDGTGDRQHAAIWFFPETPAPSYVSSGLVVGMLPLADFDDWYDILRSERPVWLYWDAESEEIPHLGALINYISLGTTDEAVGEGPADRSA